MQQEPGKYVLHSRWIPVAEQLDDRLGREPQGAEAVQYRTGEPAEGFSSHSEDNQSSNIDKLYICSCGIAVLPRDDIWLCVEVRKLGSILNVPESFLKRHPFPGPGLAVRVIGDVTTGNALEVLRQVDEIFIQAIKDACLYDEIWQAFAVFLPVQTIGVQGDHITHSPVVSLRAITSEDGMTTNWYDALNLQLYHIPV
ncbi:GMP synthase (glutamine-hydrolyzing) [Hordeum vulgare]|nr:GMP synthase (glutamine-hydrolyzing) [Hordeum vulgare]